MAESRYRRVYRKPPNAHPAALRALKERLQVSVARQNELARTCSCVLRVFNLAESPDSFSVSHEPAEAFAQFDLLDPQRPMPPVDDLAECLRAGAQALEDAYKSRPLLPHGGLTPLAFLRTPDGAIKIADFGVAPAYVQAVTMDTLRHMAVTASPDATATWDSLAVWEDQRTDWLALYVAYEHLQSGALDAFDRVSDLFSLGASLYVLSEAQHPYFDREGAMRPLDLNVFTIEGVRLKRATAIDTPAAREFARFVRKMVHLMPKQRPSPLDIVNTITRAPSASDFLPAIIEAFDRAIAGVLVRFEAFLEMPTIDRDVVAMNFVAGSRDSVAATLRARLRSADRDLGPVFEGPVVMIVSNATLEDAGSITAGVESGVRRALVEQQRGALLRRLESLTKYGAAAGDPELPTAQLQLPLATPYGDCPATCAWDSRQAEWRVDEKRLALDFNGVRTQYLQAHCEKELRPVLASLRGIETTCEYRSGTTKKGINALYATLVARNQAGRSHEVKVAIDEPSPGMVRLEPPAAEIAAAIGARFAEIDRDDAAAARREQEVAEKRAREIEQERKRRETEAARKKEEAAARERELEAARRKKEEEVRAREEEAARRKQEAETREREKTIARQKQEAREREMEAARLKEKEERERAQELRKKQPQALPGPEKKRESADSGEQRGEPDRNQPGNTDPRPPASRKRGIALAGVIVVLGCVAAAAWFLRAPGKEYPKRNPDEFIKPIQLLFIEAKFVEPECAVRADDITAPIQWDEEIGRWEWKDPDLGNELLAYCAKKYLIAQFKSKNQTEASPIVEFVDRPGLAFTGNEVAGTIAVRIDNGTPQKVAFQISAAEVVRPNSDDLSRLFSGPPATEPAEDKAEKDHPHPDTATSASGPSPPTPVVKVEDPWASTPPPTIEEADALLARKKSSRSYTVQVNAALDVIEKIKAGGPAILTDNITYPDDNIQAATYRKMYMTLDENTTMLAYVEEIGPDKARSTVDSMAAAPPLARLPTAVEWMAIARRANERDAGDPFRTSVLWEAREWCSSAGSGDTASRPNDQLMIIGGLTIKVDGKDLNIPQMIGPKDFDQWIAKQLVKPMPPDSSLDEKDKVDEANRAHARRIIPVITIPLKPE